MKKIHYFSGITIAIFVLIHLFNHAWSILGAESHIEIMNSLRVVYRNVLVELILLLAILVQMFSGLTLFKAKHKTARGVFEKIQTWSGLYLAFFFFIHLSAVLGGRHLLQLDTNFYFGVAGVNTFPLNVFFVPYYALAILSFFGHLAAAHRQKMQARIFGISTDGQAKVILWIGVLLTIIIFYGLTNHFKGVDIPPDYHILIGK